MKRLPFLKRPQCEWPEDIEERILNPQIEVQTLKYEFHECTIVIEGYPSRTVYAPDNETLLKKVRKKIEEIKDEYGKDVCLSTYDTHHTCNFEKEAIKNF